MAEFKVFEEGMEVNGATIMAVVDGMGTFRSAADSILARAGLAGVVADGEHWYSQQSWLDAFATIASEIGASTLHNIGRKIPENAVFPPEIDNIVAALGSIDIAYHMNHRNVRGQVLFDPTRPKHRQLLGGIGNYELVYEAGAPCATLICANPYPCPFDEGIITTMAKRFEDMATIRHDLKPPCRADGASCCRYVVDW